ncbi:hypothetical protein Dimus_022507, partial [Dionaea muscipula]
MEFEQRRRVEGNQRAHEMWAMADMLGIGGVWIVVGVVCRFLTKLVVLQVGPCGGTAIAGGSPAGFRCIKSKYSSLDEEDLLRYCFSSAYMVALLHDSLGIGLHDARIMSTNEVDGTPLDWALGAFILQATAEVEQHREWEQILGLFNKRSRVHKAALSLQSCTKFVLKLSGQKNFIQTAKKSVAALWCMYMKCVVAALWCMYMKCVVAYANAN